MTTSEMTTASPSSQLEQWGMFELALTGSADGNPFLDVTFGATFSHQHRSIDVDGFYDGDHDGDGVYRVRFMPDVQGEWRYRTHSNRASSMVFNVPEGEQYRAEIIDTWAMTTTPVAQPVTRGAMLPLPGKPYQAVILRRV